MGTGPHQVFADILTLFQPGEVDCAYHILISPPSFESHIKHETQIIAVIPTTNIFAVQALFVLKTNNLVPL